MIYSWSGMCPVGGAKMKRTGGFNPLLLYPKLEKKVLSLVLLYLKLSFFGLILASNVLPAISLIFSGPMWLWGPIVRRNTKAHCMGLFLANCSYLCYNLSEALTISYSLITHTENASATMLSRRRHLVLIKHKQLGDDIITPTAARRIKIILLYEDKDAHHLLPRLIDLRALRNRLCKSLVKKKKSSHFVWKCVIVEGEREIIEG